MTTTDTDALTERIGRILNDEGWTFEGVHEPGEYDECEDCRLAVDPIAVRVAREVAVEVRKAKAEALREAGRDLEREWPNRLGIDLPPEDYDHAGDHAIDTAHEYLKRRATEYEAGDTDEHR